MTIQLTPAAAENVRETGINPVLDVSAIRAGEMFEADLLTLCLDGADPDRVQGWHEYVAAVVAAAS